MQAPEPGSMDLRAEAEDWEDFQDYCRMVEERLDNEEEEQWRS